ncbi:hypothetical protein FQA47_003019 [Oryzias melastigma]|uniref:Uncharacterized protein n=1 Tax=Oryzias melastigma TaxID=30732 RepID=A0A834CF73_ORYME|nr:hypothetical protein FQA47_003019 [Oryzias melastigma]
MFPGTCGTRGGGAARGRSVFHLATSERKLKGGANGTASTRFNKSGGSLAAIGLKVFWSRLFGRAER